MNSYSFNNFFSANVGKSCLALVLTYLLASPVAGHGRLQIPRTRFHVVNGYDRYENDPTNYQKDVEATSYEGFVCRNDPPMQNGELKPTPTTAFAGDLFDVQWSLSALHAGDCAMYVSYDYDKVGADKKNMQWFKIANWLDCKSDNEQLHQIKIPSWLPAGRAVFRWDWYALHQYAQGNVEFYNQCADVTVVGSDSSLQVNQIPSYSVMNLYPEKVNLASSLESERGWRQELGLAPAQVQHWMTGPPCACRYSSENGCAETSSDAKTYGFIPKSTITVLASCGASATPSPTTPTPETTPSPTEAGPAPTPTPTPASGDCQAVWAKCGGEGWTGPTCCTTGNVCEAQSVHYSQCVPGTGPTPTQNPTSLVPPTPSPTSAVAPTPSPTDGPAPTPSPTDGPAPTPSPTDSDCSTPSDAYQQCGGQGWPANQSCCIAGYYCKVTSEWYSNCQPSSAQVGTPAPTTASNPTPQPTSGGNPVATPTPAPTPVVNPTTPTPTAEPGQINPNLNIIGYYGNSGGPACDSGNCIPRIDQIPEEYNVVVFNFLNFNSDGSIAFDIIMPHTKEELPSLIQQWKSVADPWGRARHALISIGGQNGIWPAGVTAAMLESNLKAFLEHYHFDGLDVDLEGSALSGGETVAEVLEYLIAEHYILAAAPEAAQGPLTHYDSIIPKLTYLHPQFYNNGPNAVTTPYLPEIAWPASFPSKWEEPMSGQASELASQPWWLSVLKQIGKNSNLADGQLGMLVPATEFAAGNNNIWDYQLLAADIMKHGIGYVGTWAIGHDETANYQFAKAMGLVLGPKPTN